MFKITTIPTVIPFMHYSVLLQPFPSPFDHKFPLSLVTHPFFKKFSPFLCWYSESQSSCTTRTHLTPITDRFYNLASGFSDTSSRQPTPISSSSLASPWACSMLHECWRDLLSVFISNPRLVWKRSYTNDSPGTPKRCGGHPPRPLQGWRRSTQVIGRGTQQTQPQGVLRLHRAWSCQGAVRVWAHSEAMGSSHVSTAESKKLCWVYTTLKRFVTCPSFRQRSKVASLT